MWQEGCGQDGHNDDETIAFLKLMPVKIPVEVSPISPYTLFDPPELVSFSLTQNLLSPPLDAFRCKWRSDNGTICEQPISTESVSEHLAYHGITGMRGAIKVLCKWQDCRSLMKRESIVRHVREVHLGLKRYLPREKYKARVQKGEELSQKPSTSVAVIPGSDCITMPTEEALAQGRLELVPQKYDDISNEGAVDAMGAKWGETFTVQSRPGSSGASQSRAMDKCSDQKPTREKIHLLLQQLNGLDSITKHQELAVLHMSSTCSWLYEMDEYLAWRNRNTPFLWLQGKAGSGKSVLAYSIIEHLKKSRDPVIFFYCNYRGDRVSDAVQVMYSLLRQMLNYFCENQFATPTTSWGLLVDRLLEQKTSGILIDEQQQLSLIVARTAGLFLRRPLIVIDGLDECRDIERLLDALVTWNSMDTMQILVTSRPLQIIKEKLLDVSSVISWVRFEKAASSDVLKFIEKGLGACNLLGGEPGWKERMMYDLSEKAEGMFTWAKYQVDILSGVSETRDVLNNLPAPVDFYDEIFLYIDFEQKTRSKIMGRVLAWLVCALRPIKLSEVVEALTIDLDRRTMEPERLRKDMSIIIPGRDTLELEIGSALLHVLGSLVTHDEETDCIALLHSSMKTYLTDSSTNAQYQIDLQDAHEELAATCMCYISLCLRGGLTSVNNEPPFRITASGDAQGPRHDGSPLLEYVLTKSFLHLSFLLPGNEAILGDMSALESDIQHHPEEWKYLCNIASHSRPWPSIKHDFILYTLIAFGPDWLLCAFLDHKSLSLRQEHNPGINPLIYAASFYAVEQAKTLLSRGANLQSCGWLVDDSRQALPLAVAARDQSNEMLELFLDRQDSIPPDLFRDLVSNPSIFALPVIKSLLQTDAFAEWLERHQTRRPRPLHAFIPLGHTPVNEKDLMEIVWRLVQVGFDPRAHNSNDETPLHLASAGGYLSLVEYLVSTGVPLPEDILPFVLERGYPDSRTRRVIRYLLEEGADVNYPVGDTDDNALHAVIKTATTDTKHDNLVEIVVTLVKSGCDVHLRNAENYTPLHLAIIGSHVPVVKYLSQETTPLPEDLSDAVSQAPSPVRDEIKEFLMTKYGYPPETLGPVDA